MRKWYSSSTSLWHNWQILCSTGNSIEAPSIYHLWEIVWGIVTGNDVTGSGREWLHRKLHHRKWRHPNQNRKSKGDKFPCFLPVFPAVFHELL
jgi:hypothetical protein